MINNKAVNPCVRCGSERVLLETKKEYIGESLVTTSLMGCPNLKCQHKVDLMLERERLKKEKLMKEGYYGEKIMLTKRTPHSLR